MKGALEERIRGVEHELAINTIPASYDTHFHHQLVHAAIQGLVRKGYIIKVEAKPSGANACVVYDDLGHLEISTPSYTDPLSAVIYDKAAEIYAYGGAQEVQGVEEKKVVVHKTNYSTFMSSFLMKIGLIPEELTSYATHGNFLLNRKCVKSWEKLKRAFVPNNIARIVFLGSGDVIPDSGFVISPRAMFTTVESSADTMEDRGIVNERCWEVELYRNYADVEKYMRFHDIHFEGLRCDWGVWIRDAWQTFLLNTFEMGLLDDAPKISDPVGTFRRLSMDWGGKWKVEDVQGKKLDVVEDILKGYYYEKILQGLKDRELSEMDKVSLAQFEFLFDKLSQRSFETLSSCGLDWMTKMDWLKEYELLEAKGIEDINMARRVCRAFAWIDATVMHYLGVQVDFEAYECLFNPADSLDFIRGMIPSVKWDEFPQMVKWGLTNPPETSRDYFAAFVLKKFPDEVKTRSWDEIVIGSKRILLSEPFMLRKEEAEEHLGSIETTEDLLVLIQKLYPDHLGEVLEETSGEEYLYPYMDCG